MRTRRSTELGLLCLAGAFVLSIVAVLVSYLAGLLPAAFPGANLSDLVHAFVIPYSGLALQAAIAALGLLGFAFLWRGRWAFGPAVAQPTGLAVLAFVVAAGAYAGYAVTGIFLGYLTGVAFLRPWHTVFLLAGDVALGVALYLGLAHLPVPGGRQTAAVALALGVAGCILFGLASPALRRPAILTVEGAGLALTLSSSILWVILCLWDSGRLARRGVAASALGLAHDG